MGGTMGSEGPRVDHKDADVWFNLIWKDFKHLIKKRIQVGLAPQSETSLRKTLTQLHRGSQEKSGSPTGQTLMKTQAHDKLTVESISGKQFKNMHGFGIRMNQMRCGETVHKEQCSEWSPCQMQQDPEKESPHKAQNIHPFSPQRHHPGHCQGHCWKPAAQHDLHHRYYSYRLDWFDFVKKDVWFSFCPQLNQHRKELVPKCLVAWNPKELSTSSLKKPDRGNLVMLSDWGTDR